MINITKYRQNMRSKIMLYTTLSFPIKSVTFLVPNIISKPKETKVRYPLNMSPISVYSPNALFATVKTRLLLFIAVLDKMKAISETSRGMITMSNVKLKFAAKRENKSIFFGGCDS
jgi:hypothetical protein